MALREDILRILRSGETMRINFSFTTTDGQTVTINPFAFKTVIDAIETGRIHIDSDRGQWTASGRATSDGRYNWNHNTLLARPGAPRRSRVFEALIVHECVHAFLDLRRRRLPNVDSEAAGYIAQGCYLRTSNFDRNRLNQATDNEVLTGMLIADGLAHQRRVPAALLDELRESLRSDANYRRGGYISGIFQGNG